MSATPASALLALVLPLLAPAPPARLQRVLPLMGTVLELTVEAEDRAAALAASERAVRALEAAEARLSTWREDSELSRLNRAPVDEPVPLSPDLAAELRAVSRCFEETGGAFDPGIGAVLDAWGIRTGGRTPSPAQLRRAAAGGGMASLRLAELGGADDAGRRRLAASRLRPGLRLEEGAWGKGAGLDRAVAALAAGELPVRALLDLGGQVSAAGGGTAWRVAVAHPRQRDRPVLELSLSEGSVSTSGGSERSLTVDGRRVSHLFDPRTGLPAEDFGSLTVVAGSGLLADCLSTGLYVLGSQAALAWAAEHPGIEVLVLEGTGEEVRARLTPGLARRLTPLVEGVTLEVFARPP